MKRMTGMVTGALVLAAPLLAQHPPGARAIRGFWAGMGGGVGQFSMSCTGCQGVTRIGFSGDATIGYSVGPQFQVAVQFSGDRVTDGPSAIKVGAVSALAVLALPKSSGFFIDAGLGFSHFQIKRSGPAPSLVTVSGLGWQVGVTFEYPLAPGIALTPAITYSRMGMQQAQIGGAPSTIKAGEETLRLSIGLDWHWAPILWRAPTSAR